jgi:hypothetical protein
MSLETVLREAHHNGEVARLNGSPRECPHIHWPLVMAWCDGYDGQTLKPFIEMVRIHRAERKNHQPSP